MNHNDERDHLEELANAAILQDEADDDDDDTPTNVRRRSTGRGAKRSVHHVLTSGVPSMLRAIPRRAERYQEVDVADLAALRALHDVVDQVTRDTVAALRAQGFSWGDIGRALGTTRQAAQITYGRGR